MRGLPQIVPAYFFLTALRRCSWSRHQRFVRKTFCALPADGLNDCIAEVFCSDEATIQRVLQSF